MAKTIYTEEEEIEMTAKLQAKHDKKIAAEIAEIMKEADSKNIHIPARFTNVQGIRAYIDDVLEKRNLDPAWAKVR